MPSRLSPEGFKPLADTALFEPVQIGALKLDHRIVQAPLTRMRGTKESEGVWAPDDINVEYYAQRATKGGFQLTEATNISRLVSPHNFEDGRIATNQVTSVVVTQAFQESLRQANLQAGSASRRQSMRKEDSFTVNFGMWDAQLYLR
jgi:2,4-dienoyl-CoA reductase-like NADH-dependent reductase (Old Yellow Enzyme family)